MVAKLPSLDRTQSIVILINLVRHCGFMVIQDIYSDTGGNLQSLHSKCRVGVTIVGLTVVVLIYTVRLRRVFVAGNRL